MPPVVEEKVMVVQANTYQRCHKEQPEDDVLVADPATHEVIDDLADKECRHKPQPPSSLDDVIETAAEVAMVKMDEKRKGDVRNEQRLDLLPQELLPRNGEVGAKTRNDEERLHEIPHEERHLEVIKRVQEVIGDLDEGHRSPDEMVEHEQ